MSIMAWKNCVHSNHHLLCPSLPCISLDLWKLPTVLSSCQWGCSSWWPRWLVRDLFLDGLLRASILSWGWVCLEVIQPCRPWVSFWDLLITFLGEGVGGSVWSQPSVGVVWLLHLCKVVEFGGELDHHCPGCIFLATPLIHSVVPTPPHTQLLLGVSSTFVGFLKLACPVGMWLGLKKNLSALPDLKAIRLLVPPPWTPPGPLWDF